MIKTYVSYNEIHRLCTSIIQKADQFDIIIAIGGGGLIPARICREKIKKPIYVVTVKSYDVNNNRREIQKIQWLDLPSIEAIRGKSILIIDEVDESRSTLAFVSSEIKKDCMPSKITVAVLHNKISQNKKPLESDIIYIAGEDVKSNNWIVYPWESDDLDMHNASSMFEPPMNSIDHKCVPVYLPNDTKIANGKLFKNNSDWLENARISNVRPNAIFIHYKNKYYKIICVSRSTDNPEEYFVTYEGLYDSPENGRLWTRKLNEFISKVGPNTTNVNPDQDRFTFVSWTSGR